MPNRRTNLWTCSKQTTSTRRNHEIHFTNRKAVESRPRQSEEHAICVEKRNVTKQNRNIEKWNTNLFQSTTRRQETHLSVRLSTLAQRRCWATTRTSQIKTKWLNRRCQMTHSFNYKMRFACTMHITFRFRYLISIRKRKKNCIYLFIRRAGHRALPCSAFRAPVFTIEMDLFGCVQRIKYNNNKIVHRKCHCHRMSKAKVASPWMWMRWKCVSACALSMWWMYELCGHQMKWNEIQ